MRIWPRCCRKHWRKKTCCDQINSRQHSWPTWRCCTPSTIFMATNTGTSFVLFSFETVILTLQHDHRPQYVIGKGQNKSIATEETQIWCGNSFCHLTDCCKNSVPPYTSQRCHKSYGSAGRHAQLIGGVCSCPHSTGMVVVIKKYSVYVLLNSTPKKQL